MITFQTQLNAAIKVVAEQELAAFQQDIQKHFFTSLYNLSMLIWINQDLSRPNHPTRALALCVIEVHGSMLVKHTSLTASNVYAKYKDAMGDPEVHKPSSLAEELQLAVAPFIDPTFKIMEDIFVLAWEHTSKKLDEQEKAAAMKVYIKTRSTEKSTEDTAMHIEAKPAVNSETIQELIKAGIKEETKCLQTQVNTLQNKMSISPKDTRGASPACALSTKKNAAKKRQQQPKDKKDKKDKTNEHPKGKHKSNRPKQRRNKMPK